MAAHLHNTRECFEIFQKWNLFELIHDALLTASSTNVWIIVIRYVLMFKGLVPTASTGS